MPLRHHLEQRRLHLGRRPVDLVGEHEVGHHRAEFDVELLTADPVDPGAEQVGGHQVGGELDPGEGPADHPGERLDGQRLGHPGDALDQQVPLGQQADQHPLDQPVLPDDHPLDLEDRALQQRRVAGRRVHRLAEPGHAATGPAGRRRGHALCAQSSALIHRRSMPLGSPAPPRQVHHADHCPGMAADLVVLIAEHHPQSRRPCATRSLIASAGAIVRRSSGVSMSIASRRAPATRRSGSARTAPSVRRRASSPAAARRPAARPAARRRPGTGDGRPRRAAPRRRLPDRRPHRGTQPRDGFGGDIRQVGGQHRDQRIRRNGPGRVPGDPASVRQPAATAAAGPPPGGSLTHGQDRPAARLLGWSDNDDERAGHSGQRAVQQGPSVAVGQLGFVHLAQSAAAAAGQHDRRGGHCHRLSRS